MTDKKITCLKCQAEFTFTAGEQEWYLNRNLHEPKYCKACREERSKAREEQQKKTYQNHDKKAI